MVGTMAKIDDSVKKKVPELRFKGFTDDWEERKLSSGLREYTDRVIVEDDKEYYQISVRNNFGGITLRGSKMGNKIGRKRQAKINLTKYPQTLIFTRQTVEQGGIGWVDKYCDGAIVTENMPTISLDTSVFSKYFLTNLFQTRIFYKNAILDNVEGGSAQIAIHESKFLSSTLLFPNLDEQEKIGQFFKQLDDTIDLHQRKLDLLKEQKKGFLQKMFPKNGAKIPELRFAGFADDWEERKLGEFSDVRDGTHASPKYVSQGHPMVTSKNLTHSGLDMTDVSFLTDEDFNEINKRSKVSIGDILFGMIGTIGNPVIVDRDDFAIKNVALIKEKTSNPITNKWLLQYLKSPSFNQFIQKENAGGTQKFIALGLIRDMKLRVPEFDEQQKIGAFFKKIDETITLHQRKLDLLKEQKKGFLQKMFV
ncbi:restriction endonuclease subunit S [Leuconostoc mesenteroides]|uniref:restriction endonuclease subunit S n=1 Tax=Leuconostoc mesenteroides TaxID=1245 RepID=UPI003A4E4880